MLPFYLNILCSKVSSLWWCTYPFHLTYPFLLSGAVSAKSPSNQAGRNVEAASRRFTSSTKTTLPQGCHCEEPHSMDGFENWGALRPLHSVLPAAPRPLLYFLEGTNTQVAFWLVILT